MMKKEGGLLSVNEPKMIGLMSQATTARTGETLQQK
jgi:hypothetical protein